MSKLIILDGMSFNAPFSFIRPRKRKQFAEGIIRIRRLPDDWTDEDYRYWWLPETDGKGKILRPARMSEKEKRSYQEREEVNQIMNAGRTQILSYIGATSGSSTAFAQYFAIGTGSITSVSPTDSSLANEVFRKTPTTYGVSGTQVDINIQLGNTDAEVSMSNVGIFGNGATSTLGSGTLLTHALFTYTKGNYAIAIDYLINLL